MQSTTFKALVAVALAAVAGQSFAIHSVNGPSGGPYNADHYCAGLDRKSGSGLTIVQPTLALCEKKLKEARDENEDDIKSFYGCHTCVQKFSYLIGTDPGPTSGTLDPAVVDVYIEVSNELRRRYNIDGFERDMEKLTRSLSGSLSTK